LHLNNGNGSFSDIGQMACVERTGWSWSPLIADLDLDGYKDIYVTNGLAKDVTSQDYIAFLTSRETMVQATRGARVDFRRLVDAMSSTKLPNYAFRNRGDLTFANTSAAWGLDTPGFSNGAAYGDLDGDGALDLVVNNVNQEAFIYRNNARTLTPNHYLQVRLEGSGANRFAIGAKVTLWSGGQQFFQEEEPTRGFQSSVDYILTFGVGLRDKLHSVKVEWPVWGGPMLAVADVNGDGLDDMFIGGTKGQAGKLLIQQPDGRFVSRNEKLFEADATSEDLGAVFFDANGDGRPDLYVVSGGSAFSPGS